MLGRLLLERGKKPEGEAQLIEVIEAYNEDRLPDDRAASLCYVAMAARALGSWHDANDAFREAALADRTRVETQLEWAQLFLDKYDQRTPRRACSRRSITNPNSPLAHALMARLAIARAVDFPRRSEHLDEALAVNPSLVAAHVTRAAIALRDMDIDAADHHLDGRAHGRPERPRGAQRARRGALPGRRRARLRAGQGARCSRATRATRGCTASSPSTPSGSTATTSWWAWRARRSRSTTKTRSPTPRSA